MNFIAIEQNESTVGELLYLPPKEVAKLYQIAQSGASSSLASLKDFLGTQADIHLNCLSFLPLPVMIERIKMFYPRHLGFHLRFLGEINGEIYFLFRESDVYNLLESMMGRKKIRYGRRLNRIETSVLAELVNILSNSFWRSLTEETFINWWIHPPVQVNDLAKTLSYSAKIYTLDHLLIHLEYLVPVSEIRIQFIILPSQNTLKKIFTKLEPVPQPQEEVV